MQDQQYSVNQYKISNILSSLETGNIAIPEIQRPFVWKSKKVTDLIDSLYHSYPIGYIIIWQKPDVRLKDGSNSNAKDVIIDGQQRITSLKAALLGEEVLNSDFKKVRIKVAFNPLEEKFETLTPAIEKNSLWIPDISVLFNGEKSTLSLYSEYMENNKDKNIDAKTIEKNLSKLSEIKHNQIGAIMLGEELKIETVTEIFHRINSKGVSLGQYDFVMSKIASREEYNGVNIRKIIDYFHHLVKRPEDYSIINNDEEFKTTEWYSKIIWVKDKPMKLYTPTYEDIIRVAFTHKFGRGKLNDLVSLLSGRNFEKRCWEEEIAETTFKTFLEGILNVVNKTYIERFIMIIQSIGFIRSDMISSNMAIDFAYALYLFLKTGVKMEDTQIERYVQKWFVLSLLTGRYSGSSETRIDEDIRKIQETGIEKALIEFEQNTLSENFWKYALPSYLTKHTVTDSHFNIYLAALCKDKARGFLSKNISVHDMISNRGDIHHLYPKEYLKNNKVEQTEYNQVANYVYCETPINIKISDTAPKEYMKAVVNQLNSEEARLSGILTKEDLKKNLKECDIPDIIFDGSVNNYQNFLKERRVLMAKRIKKYWESL